jgi:circadian clock protein KaiB
LHGFLKRAKMIWSADKLAQERIMIPREQRERLDRWNLSLFIAGGEHPKSVAAYANIKRICEEHLPGEYSLQVVDITEFPEAAVSEQILAVPTLVRQAPKPTRRIIGDLSDTNRVLISLGVHTIRATLPA